MSEQAAHLVDRILPRAPYRQWVLTLPWDLARRVAFDASLCAAVFAIFADTLSRWHCDRAIASGIAAPSAGCVLEVQRFADGARLYPHAHALAPQGVFYETNDGQTGFHPLPPPKRSDVLNVAQQIERRVRRLLRRRGLLSDNPTPDDPSADERQLLLLLASAQPCDREVVTNSPGSISATRPKRSKQKRLCVRSGGFEVHAAVSVPANDRAGLERLCRYIGRPPLPTNRIRLRADGRVVFDLKRTWSGGVRALIYEPLSFLARIAALVPPPGFHLRRFYGVFAPNHPLRSRIVPRPPNPARVGKPTAPKRPKSMAWTDLLKRVFKVDVLSCPECGGRMRIIAVIQQPDAVDAVIAAVILSGRLEHVRAGRAPPRGGVRSCFVEPC